MLISKSIDQTYNHLTILLSLVLICKTNSQTIRERARGRLLGQAANLTMTTKTKEQHREVIIMAGSATEIQKGNSIPPNDDDDDTMDSIIETMVVV